MSTARVGSIDALRAFRAALIRFAEGANVAISDAEGEIHATIRWLERDQLTHWNHQVRKRHEAVEKAREAVRHKQLFKSPTGGKQSDVDEQKALAKARAALEEAEMKLVNTRRSIGRLNKQFLEYQGPVQRFTSTMQVDVPTAIAELDRIVASLDEYAALSAPSLVERSASDDAARMGRGATASAAAQRDWHQLRSRTPVASERVAAEAGLMTFAPWKSGILKLAQREDLARLAGERHLPAPDHRLVLAKNASDREAIYLHRVPPAFENDSGWYIGSADADMERLETLSLTDFLATRNDLREILMLPEGTLVGIENGIAQVVPL